MTIVYRTPDTIAYTQMGYEAVLGFKSELTKQSAKHPLS